MYLKYTYFTKSHDNGTLSMAGKNFFISYNRADKVNAHCRDGILSITIAKQEARKPRQIAVKVD